VGAETFRRPSGTAGKYPAIPRALGVEPWSFRTRDRGFSA
jgi:hypothetical protein